MQRSRASLDPDIRAVIMLLLEFYTTQSKSHQDKASLDTKGGKSPPPTKICSHIRKGMVSA